MDLITDLSVITFSQDDFVLRVFFETFLTKLIKDRTPVRMSSTII